MLTTNDKEDIHISYLSAVCASASVSFDLQRHDDDSTDGIMKKLITLDDGTKYMSSLRIQLKCTSSVSQYTDDEEILAKDIERVTNGKKPTQDFNNRRFTVK